MRAHPSIDAWAGVRASRVLLRARACACHCARSGCVCVCSASALATFSHCSCHSVTRAFNCTLGFEGEGPPAGKKARAPQRCPVCGEGPPRAIMDHPSCLRVTTTTMTTITCLRCSEAASATHHGGHSNAGADITVGADAIKQGLLSSISFVGSPSVFLCW
jgi:hypothetical protein